MIFNRLTPDRIAAEALALIDEAGLPAFSTRKLGARLSVEAMALYHHFPSRPLLLEAVADRLLSDIVLPPESLGWRAWCGQAVRAWRSAALAHPGAFPLLAARNADAHAAYFAAERRVFVNAGFSDVEAVRSAHILNGFVCGTVQSEIAAPAGAAGAFERGLVMIFDGIARNLQRARAAASLSPGSGLS